MVMSLNENCSCTVWDSCPQQGQTRGQRTPALILLSVDTRHIHTYNIYTTFKVLNRHIRNIKQLEVSLPLCAVSSHFSQHLVPVLSLHLSSAHSGCVFCHQLDCNISVLIQGNGQPTSIDEPLKGKCLQKCIDQRKWDFVSLTLCQSTF